MNLHPIFVHFPIAFLTLYAAMELFRFNKFTRQPWWFYTKAVLLVAGSVSSLAARQSGELAAKIFSNGAPLPILEKHELFANLTVAIFAALALVHILVWIKKSREFTNPLFSQTGFLRAAENFLNSPFSWLLALIGLAAVTITGGLGGMLVYGGSADPAFAWFYQKFLTK